MSIGFIFTNFNNTQFTEGVVLSIVSSDAVDAPIIVVDNASKVEHVESLRLLESKHKNLTVIYNKENIGYFSGLNVGIHHARSLFSSIAYWVIGNNDLIFSEDIHSQIVSSQKALDKYPVVSPNIVTIDGVPQNPHVIHKISKIGRAVQQECRD